MSVYEKIRVYIDENKLKRVVVAQKAGIPRTTFNAILTGRKILYAEDLIKICWALQVSPEIFIDYKSA